MEEFGRTATRQEEVDALLTKINKGEKIEIEDTKVKQIIVTISAIVEVNDDMINAMKEVEDMASAASDFGSYVSCKQTFIVEV